MPENCNINKNHLLDLYFQELQPREAEKIRKHADQCRECREYLATLAQTNQALHQWQDRAPLPNTLDLILERIPAAEPLPAAAKPGTAMISAAPFLKIVFSMATVLGILFFLHDKVIHFAFWETLQQWWFVKIFGSLGVTAVLFFLLGALITLAISPVLILESQSRAAARPA